MINLIFIQRSTLKFPYLQEFRGTFFSNMYIQANFGPIMPLKGIGSLERFIWSSFQPRSGTSTSTEKHRWNIVNDFATAAIDDTCNPVTIAEQLFLDEIDSQCWAVFSHCIRFNTSHYSHFEYKPQKDEKTCIVFVEI